MAPSAPAVEMRSFGGNDLKVHVVDTAAPYETVPLDESSDLSSGKGAPICGASGDYGRSYLTFENLSFKVRADQRSRDIRTLASSLNAFKRSRKYDAVVLEGVSGHLAPGSLTLLLGGPRSGKSTLLKILAGRTSDLKNGTVGGQVRINGAAPDETYRRRVTLVEQADVHYPLLTVRETLRFAGSLRTPREGVTEAEVDRKADEVLARLNLTHTADTIVGNQAIRGISGGEKRRLTIACEAMAGGNTVMLLDQASDGLDATATLELCRSLRRLAEGGMAIMACLLQPSWEAFCCFDNVLMLAGGRVAYAGPRGGAIGHFEGLGYGRPEGMTPQDFLQWVTEHPGESMYKGPGRPLGPRQFADAFAASPAARLEAGRREEAGQAGRREAAPRVQLRGEYAQPFGRQFRELFGRYVKLLGRNPGPNVGRFVTQICLLGFVLGTLYCQMPRTLRGAMNRVAFLQAAVLGFGFLSLSKTDGYFQDRAMLYKEDLARYYRPVAWYLAILLAELPRLFLEVLVFSCITYWAGGLQGADGGQRFGKYILALFLMSATSDMTTFAVVAWTPVVQIGAVVASIIPPIYLMFNGFLVPKELIPKPWIWMHYFSFYRYPHEALTISELHDLPLDGVPAGGRYVLEYFTLNTDTAWYWYNMAIMFGQFLFYVSIGLAGFTYRRWPKSFQAPLREEEEDPDDAPHAITMAAHPGASMAHFAPPRAALTFKELSYAVTLPKKAGGGQKTLLHKISGFARSGELCALMGPSGGGKTTLLDVLADRKTGGAVAGELLINGTPRDNFFLRISGYVEQFDLLYPTMTVREAVALSARLRLEGRSEAERDAAVTAALECLHLVHHAGEMVGSPATGGIPVALRKKLSIAMELVTQPSILFLDEPTTGLDAVSAMQVVQLLHELAAKGQAIICTIHQPSAELIKSFDSLLLLKKGGEVVYSGPMGPACRDVLAYFARLGFPCPDTRNPADHLLDVIQGKVAGPKGADAVDFAAAWAGSPEAAEARAQLDALNARASDCSAPPPAPAPAPPPPSHTPARSREALRAGIRDGAGGADGAAGEAAAAAPVAGPAAHLGQAPLQPPRGLHHRDAVGADGGLAARGAHADVVHLLVDHVHVLPGAGRHPRPLRRPRGLLPRALPGPLPGGGPLARPFHRHRPLQLRQPPRLRRHDLLDRGDERGGERPTLRRQRLLHLRVAALQRHLLRVPLLPPPRPRRRPGPRLHGHRPRLLLRRLHDPQHRHPQALGVDVLPVALPLHDRVADWERDARAHVPRLRPAARRRRHLLHDGGPGCGQLRVRLRAGLAECRLPCDILVVLRGPQGLRHAPRLPPQALDPPLHIRILVLTCACVASIQA